MLIPDIANPIKVTREQYRVFLRRFRSGLSNHSPRIMFFRHPPIEVSKPTPFRYDLYGDLLMAVLLEMHITDVKYCLF